MSEYWKSTPKYWCKHCSVYVRDTKLERTNHELTGKHQGAIKRSLRDLHRGAEQKERDEERAKREVARLNGLVSGDNNNAGGSSSSFSEFAAAPNPKRAPPGARTLGGGQPQPQPQQQQTKVTEAERQRQLQQLAELGVAIPTELRPTMAMPGEWTVTATRVVDEGRQEGGGEGERGEGRAVGVKRERERTEEEKEREEAISGLFKRSRKWGVDSKRMPGEEDRELEELLAGRGEKVKKEEREEESTGSIATAMPATATTNVKQEPGDDDAGLDTEATGESKASVPDLATAKDEAEPPVVMFKKRKAKNVRQK
ncbi:hypothetical protein B0T17DRAFT_555161 [Bombardia bombarda]|uniref:U1-C C2H2-type zinc finger domain-containing protein n=1 Tax=Bombardia bombarda TaxID=252184 RepID=A0AA40C8N8_9PEZI|nr:hypothetical protein B0T17DRAFT_555161 [Bombardia bombarda]